MTCSKASIPEEFKDASTSLAVDWTDLESFSRPPPHGAGDCADPEASWGHRKNNLLRQRETSCSTATTCSAAIMMREENGPPVPELARRATVSSCRHDPVRAVRPRADRDARQPGSGSATSSPIPATPTATRTPGPSRSRRRRRPGPGPAPHDRGPKGTHDGAIIANGNLYCPATPAPAGTRAAGPHRHPGAGRRARPQTAELARHKLGRITADDADGYHRVQCPAAMGKIRCPLRPASMPWTGTGPRSSAPPSTPRPAAPSRPITVPPEVPPRPRRNTTTRQSLAPLLRPAHRRRARLRHRQGPRHQRHRPRLVPPDGPDPAHAVHHHPAHRPQPAHPAAWNTRQEDNAGAAPPPGCPRKPAGQTAPQDPRRPRRRCPPTPSQCAPVRPARSLAQRHPRLRRPRRGSTPRSNTADRARHCAPSACLRPSGTRTCHQATGHRPQSHAGCRPR
jgi:hypothetical protein